MSPGYDKAVADAAIEADYEAGDEADEAGNALTTIVPTTLAGIVALIRYIEEFNAGGYGLEDYGDLAPTFWPDDRDEDEIQLFG